MAHARPQAPTISRIRPLSADFAPRPKESMLYSMLPSVIQCRLPRLPSIRRSVSMYGSVARRKSTASDSRPNSGMRISDAGFTSAIVLSGAREEEVAEYIVESASDEDASRPGTGEGRQPGEMELTESSSGIGWKFANQGVEIHSQHKGTRSND